MHINLKTLAKGIDDMLQAAGEAHVKSFLKSLLRRMCGKLQRKPLKKRVGLEGRWRHRVQLRVGNGEGW